MSAVPLVEDSESEDRLIELAQAGIADIAAGRYVTVDGPEAADALHARFMRRLRAALARDRASH